MEFPPKMLIGPEGKATKDIYGLDEHPRGVLFVV